MSLRGRSFALALPVLGAIALVMLSAASGSRGLGVPDHAVKLAACDLFASPTGRAEASGTIDDPLSGPKQLVGRLASGETGCLREGRYTLADQLLISTPGVGLRSAPGEEATVRGAIALMPEATGARLEQLRLDGRNEEGDLGPLIYADGATLRGNEITNRNAPLICVHVDQKPGYGRPAGVRVIGNEIHHCGSLPRTNFHHGIYLAESEGTIIRGNWIHHNADRGVQLYPDADGTVVSGNVIENNGQGLAFGGAGGSTADRSVVVKNVIRHSRAGYEVGSAYPPSTPAGMANAVAANCLIGDRAFSGTRGYTAEGNAVLDRSRSKDGAVESLARRGCESDALRSPAADALARLGR